MAKRPKTPRLSPGELEILAMLWQRGPLTLAEAHRQFGHFGCPVGYTTIQTRLNRLVGKGAVKRDPRRPARYQAVVQPEEVSTRALDLLLDKLQGSVVPMVAHLISGRSLSAGELRELRRLLAEAEASGEPDRKREEEP